MRYTFSQIVGLWPSRKHLALDIGRKPVVVERWDQDDSIPGTSFRKVLQAAAARGIDLTADDLIDAAASKPTRTQGSKRTADAQQANG